MLNYRVIHKANPRDPHGDKMYIGHLVSSGTTNLRGLFEMIGDGSTTTTQDAYAVFEGMLRMVPRQLLMGQILKLSDFGTIWLSMQSAPSLFKDDFTKANIKGVKINFTPGKLLKEPLLFPDYKRID